jgi:hypothetical protein
MRAYSDRTRESDPWSLSDLEVFKLSAEDFRTADHDTWMHEFNDGDASRCAGWYYWYCFPGCLPDSDAFGPYASEDAALEAAREES